MGIIQTMTSKSEEHGDGRRQPRTTESDAGTPSFRFPPRWPEDTGLARNPVEGTGDAGHNVEPDGFGFEVQGVYIISVAARILDMHPQTLRKYERLGLINPVRTVGMLRLYSQGDIRKILLIRHLMDNLGLNLAGVELALALVENLGKMQRRVGSLPEDDPARKLVEEEISQLCRNLNLPEPGFVPGEAAPQQEKQGPYNDQSQRER